MSLPDPYPSEIHTLNNRNAVSLGRRLHLGRRVANYLGQFPPPLRTLVLTLSPTAFFMVLLLGFVIAPAIFIGASYCAQFKSKLCRFAKSVTATQWQLPSNMTIQHNWIVGYVSNSVTPATRRKRQKFDGPIVSAGCFGCAFSTVKDLTPYMTYRFTHHAT